MLILLFSNKQQLIKRKDCLLDLMCICVFAVLNKQFLTWEIRLRGGKVCSQDFSFSLSFCGTIRNLSQTGGWGVVVPPFSHLAQQAQVLCELCGGGGPESVRCLWLCMVQRCRGCVACETCIHCSLVEQCWIELGRLSRHERQRDRQRKRKREIQREREEGFQLTMEFILPL